MLIVSKEHKSINELVNEDLSEDGLHMLLHALERDPKVDLNDENVEEYAKAIKSYVIKNDIDKKYGKFFTNHDIAHHKDAIVKAFMDKHREDLLAKIITPNGNDNDDGLIDLEDLNNGEDIYTVCKSKVKGTDDDKEALNDILKSITGISGKSVSGNLEGDYETLLKLIIKGSSGSKSSDLQVGGDTIEVKKVGGHVGTTGVRQNEAIFPFIDKVFGINDGKTLNYSLDRNNREFNKRLDDYKGNREDIRDAIVSGVAHQYKLEKPTEAMKRIAKLYSFSSKVSSAEIKQLIGHLQLAAYLDTIRATKFIVFDRLGNYVLINKEDIVNAPKNLTFYDIETTGRMGARVTFTAPKS